MTRLDEIAARLAAATPGPWQTVPSWYPGYVAAFDSSRGTQVVAEGHGVRLAANADLIAHAPEDLAALLAVARAARGLLTALVVGDDPDEHMDALGDAFEDLEAKP